MASGSGKRKLEAAVHSSVKKAKVHPFFNLTKERQENPFWKESVQGTCKHGCSNGFNESPKIAAFDLDGTIIVPKEGRKFPTSSTDWQWWRKSVPTRLKKLHQDGFAIVFLTNQRLTSTRLTAWLDKVPLIAEAIPDVPFRVLAATESDVFRKPLPGMWWEVEKFATADGIIIDKSASFFVGDAAGRTNDHSAADRKFALNVGLQFHSPEAFFLGLPEAPYKLEGFDAAKYLTSSRITPPSVDQTIHTRDSPEIVLFVGCPGIGKSSFYRRNFEPKGYVHVNQDTLKRREKCLSAVSESIRAGKSCVVDNTNRNLATRKLYVELAERLNCPIRCMVFNGDLKMAWHNVIYRTWFRTPMTKLTEPSRALVPYGVLQGYHKEFETPQLSEGFSEIKHVEWVFVGSRDDEARWKLWLEL